MAISRTDSDLPHVTDILKDAGLIDTTFFTEWSRDRGKAVHLACELSDKGMLNETDLDPAVAPRLEMYRKFLKEVKPEILGIEEYVEYPKAYCGTLDRRMVINGFPGVLDIKNGNPAPWHALQVMLYSLCLKPCPMKRWGLYLLDYRYKLVEFTNSEDKRVALSAVYLAAWKGRNGYVK
jgi:hypothetical protein